MPLAQIFSHLRLVTADTLAPPTSPTSPVSQEFPLLRGRVHEFVGSGQSPPLTAMLGLAARTLLPHEHLLFLGRPCWPTFQVLSAMLDTPSEGVHPSQIETQKSKIENPLARCLFLDPPSPKERFWALAEALRCPGIGAVIADGEGLDATASRRLQLAAEARQGTRGALALLARPDAARAQVSWAATRWQVLPWRSPQARPPPQDRAAGRWMEVRSGNAPSSPADLLQLQDSLSTRMSWELTLMRSRQGSSAALADAERWIFSWTYQVCRGTGALDLSPAVGHSTAQTPIAQPA